jgi:CheY-like chemotaxis protein
MNIEGTLTDTNYLVIDDNSWLLIQKVQGSYQQNMDYLEFRQSIGQAKTWIETNYDQLQAAKLILINISIKSEGGFRQNQDGVEMIKWMKLLGIRTPILAYSFERLHDLLHRKPENLILCAPGIRYQRLPFLLNEIEINSIESKSEIKPYIRGSFDWGQFRHDIANWWGLKQLWDVHNAISEINLPRPKGIEKRLHEINNAFAEFLYSRPGSTIEGQVEIKRKEAKSIFFQIRKQRLKILHIEDEWALGWSQMLTNLISNDFDTIEIKESPVFTDHLNGNGIACRSLNVFRDNKHLEDEEEVYDAVHKALRSDDFRPNVIVIDLRLMGEKGAPDRSNYAFETLGLSLLAEIRDEYPWIPILFTTASNKIWSYQAVMDFGADEYWVKEGLNIEQKADETVENYMQLLKFLERLGGKEYRFVKEVSKRISRFSELASNSLWWETEPWWPRGKTTDKALMVEILTFSLSMYRTEIANRKREKKENDRLTWVIPSLIVQNLGKILEIVHNSEGRGTTDRMETRGDVEGAKLYQLRGEASHFRASQYITWEKAENYLKRILAWIKV